MKKTSGIFLLLFLLLSVESIFASGKKEKQPVILQEVEVRGTVRMVGNSPMTSIVISGVRCDSNLHQDSGVNRDWYIEPKEEQKLIMLQQQMVTVSVQEYYYDRIFANGNSAGRQYFLKDIVIIGYE